MRKIIFLSAVICISLFSCQKEQITPTNTKEFVKPSKKSEDNMTKGMRCTPWRDAADADAAVIDLNAIVLCNTSTCSNGVSNYFYLNGRIARDGSGIALNFPAYTTVTIADQNAVWSNAVSQAVANTPTGFVLSSVHNFRTEVAGTMFLSYMIKFDITYVKCAAGGGGGES